MRRFSSVVINVVEENFRRIFDFFLGGDDFIRMNVYYREDVDNESYFTMEDYSVFISGVDLVSFL